MLQDNFRESLKFQLSRHKVGWSAAALVTPIKPNVPGDLNLSSTQELNNLTATCILSSLGHSL